MVGTGDGCITTLPVASMVILQLSRWPLVEDTSAVLAIAVVPATFTVALNDLWASLPAASVPIVQVTTLVAAS